MKDGGKLFAAPGNPGIAQDAECISLDVTDHGAVITFCDEQDVGLVVIGPEAPLVNGLADSLDIAEIPCFGPSKAAAQLEGSKSFTKSICDRASIPTAGYVHATSLEQATAALDKFSAPFVLKADGLAAGKGVVIAENRAEAEEALVDMFGGRFGDAGAEVVIEEFMDGEEVSLFALTDGEAIMAFGTAQDHKRVGEGDTGPNTGGMGAYSPASILSDEMLAGVMKDIIAPTVKQMAADGTPYSGVLYAGLMLTSEGPKLVEYNCRFGDPEAQVLMMRLEGDLAEYMLACANGALADMAEPSFSDQATLTVVMAAKNYPDSPEKGGAISNLDEAAEEGAMIFHAGTKLTEEGALIANGGRVLTVTASGTNTAQAQKSAYAAVDKVDFATGFCRRDIGWREIGRG